MKQKIEKYFLFLFIIHLQQYHANSLRLNELCIKSVTTQCDDLYGYTCGRDYCAVDEATCKTFLKFKSALSRITVEQLLDDQIRKFQRFIKKIKECQILPNICSNGSHCYQKQFYPMRNGRISILLDISCPCIGKYNYNCDKLHCATHMKACEELSLVNANYSSRIQKCGNDNKIILKT